MTEYSIPEERRAPVQGFSAGIPWAMHLRAYDAYCKKYRSQQALIEGGCRGGFSTRELDMFIPGWRDELDERKQLKERIAGLEAQVKTLREALEDVMKYVNRPYSYKARGESFTKARAALAATEKP